MASAMTSPSGSPETMGSELREMAITMAPSKLGFTPDADYPNVYGVLVDWPFGDQVVTVLALRDGTGSLYTTATFAITGGSRRPAIRAAATRLVRTAERFATAGRQVSSFPYPEGGTVYYYLLTYAGVRRCQGDMEAIERGADPTTALFLAAQDEITALRLASEAVSTSGRRAGRAVWRSK